MYPCARVSTLPPALSRAHTSHLLSCIKWDSWEHLAPPEALRVTGSWHGQHFCMLPGCTACHGQALTCGLTSIVVTAAQSFRNHLPKEHRILAPTHQAPALLEVEACDRHSPTPFDPVTQSPSPVGWGWGFHSRHRLSDPCTLLKLALKEQGWRLGEGCVSTSVGEVQWWCCLHIQCLQHLLEVFIRAPSLSALAWAGLASQQLLQALAPGPWPASASLSSVP